MLCDMLPLEGHKIGRKHVSTLKKLDIQAVYRKTNTSGRYPAHRTPPYRRVHVLLRRESWKDNH